MKLAYRHQLFYPNTVKQEQLAALFPPFHTACRTVSLYWLHRLEQGELMPTHMRLPDRRKLCGLSSRQMNSVGSMCRNSILSWLELLTNRVRGYISHTVPVPPDKRKPDDPSKPSDRMILYRINKRHLWWMRDVVLYWRYREGRDHVKRIEPCGMNAQGAFPLQVEERLLFLSRRMVKQARKHISFPDLRRTRTILLEEEAAKVERPETTFKDISWWIRISTLQAKRPVWVGLRRNEYFETEYRKTLELEGKRCRVIQLHHDREHNRYDISLICERPDSKPRAQGDMMGIDYGASDALMATSRGDLYGHGMLDRLKQLDRLMIARQKWCQYWKIPLRKDDYYQKLQKRIRDYAANEVGRILNRIAVQDDGEQTIRELVFERLDFRYGGMSRTTNRIITRIGRRVLKQRQEALTLKHGITVTLVPSQYTSQECSSCGYTNHLNRTKRSRFTCRFCGRTLHADINAARVIRSRRSWTQPDNTGRKARANTFHMLESRHRQRWNLPDTWNGPGRSRRSGPSSEPQQPTRKRKGTYRMPSNSMK